MALEDAHFMPETETMMKSKKIVLTVIFPLIVLGATEAVARDCLRSGDRYVRFLGEAGPTSPSFPEPFTYDLCYKQGAPRALGIDPISGEAKLTWNGTGSLYFQLDSGRTEFTEVTNTAVSNNANVPPDILNSSLRGPETIPGFSIINANPLSLLQYDNGWKDVIPTPERISENFNNGAIAFRNIENPSTPISGPLTHAFADSDILNVYFVAGQSNASGRSSLSFVPEVNDSEVKLYANRDNFSGQIHWDDLGPQQSGTHSFGFGPEIGIGRHLNNTGVPNVHIVKVSEGGTFLGEGAEAKSWNSREGGGLYQRWLAEADSAIDLLQAANPSTPISVNGVFWMQGESDANRNRPSRQEDYIYNMAAVAWDFERDLRKLLVGSTPEDANPFVMVQSELPFFMGVLNSGIFTNNVEPMTQESLNRIRQAQQRLCQIDAQFTCVSTEGLQFRSDNIHFNDQGLLELGKRFGKAYVDVPEPGAWMLMSLGLAGLIFAQISSANRTRKAPSGRIFGTT